MVAKPLSKRAGNGDLFPLNKAGKSSEAQKRSQVGITDDGVANDKTSSASSTPKAKPSVTSFSLANQEILIGEERGVCEGEG